MQGNRSRDTAPELAVRRACHARGLRYRVGVAPIAGLRRSADMVFSSARIAVYIDGCFWHSCPDHVPNQRRNADYWTAKLSRNVERDKDTNRRLAALGWTVLRFWEHEDPEAAAARIAETVAQRLDREPDV
jgi:DNA mismatch endonuclease, patch repair protein